MNALSHFSNGRFSHSIHVFKKKAKYVFYLFVGGPGSPRRTDFQLVRSVSERKELTAQLKDGTKPPVEKQFVRDRVPRTGRVQQPYPLSPVIRELISVEILQITRVIPDAL